MSQKSTDDFLQKEFLIEDVETLKVLAHPQRLEILRNMEHPRTVKEVAERIKADPTKLYYHVRMMEKAGIIRITDTNVVSGIIEKQYQVVARGYKVAEGLVTAESIDDGTLTDLADSIFDSTQHMLRKSVQAGLFKPDGQYPYQTSALLTDMFRLNDDQLREFNEQMQAISDNLNRWTKENEDSNAQPYLFTIAFFPTVRNR